MNTLEKTGVEDDTVRVCGVVVPVDNGIDLVVVPVDNGIGFVLVVPVDNGIGFGMVLIVGRGLGAVGQPCEQDWIVVDTVTKVVDEFHPGYHLCCNPLAAAAPTTANRANADFMMMKSYTR